MALIVKAHAIDDAFGRRNAEQARLVIARLRARRHRADFGHAETHQGQLAGDFGILVEAGCHTHGVGQVEPAKLGCQLRRILVLLLGRQPQAQRSDGRAMGGFGIHAQQGIAGQGLQAR